ncbi:hypothetical protein [Saccharopolyspora mangrovi]|uniref:SdpI family protein n=1 Tax=Saccharopolyspora mangrovi TaxID=3082379 RepID=A0ABU6A9X1_9PSEU|nr:hypothetical protein [Saccharopolyspora sp. S2-29]MEB3368350.1 hypothetical protein [Saccharopolyspora sp. S2-29]
MTSDQIVAVIALSTFGVTTVGITVAMFVLNRRSPNRRTIRQAWAQASKSERWLWVMPCVGLPGFLWNAFRPDDLPRPVSSLITLALIVALLVPLAGFGRAWRQERRAARGDRNA